jgi:NTE family protein
MTTNDHRREAQVLVLQGGGALGAYQAGAYEALAKAGIEPEWVAGISIGAINAVLIAGNEPANRVSRLRTFWDRVTSANLYEPTIDGTQTREAFNHWSSAYVAATGAPGFFAPRLPPAAMMPPGSLGALSYYDSSPLVETLNELVDWQYLRNHGPRLSVGAVNIRNGNFVYFDTKDRVLDARHILASGALPPGLPPVMIDGDAYWDGGVVSNAPLQYILEYSGAREDMVIFQVDVFNARGPMPQTLLDVQQREKDIRYSSRTRLLTDTFKRMQTLRRAAQHIVHKLPPGFAVDKDVEVLRSFGCDAAVTIVHLIHRRAAYEVQSQDYEFSRLSMSEHWQSGGNDVVNTLRHPDWRHRQRPDEGVAVFDLAHD